MPAFVNAPLMSVPTANGVNDKAGFTWNHDCRAFDHRTGCGSGRGCLHPASVGTRPRWPRRHLRADGQPGGPCILPAARPPSCLDPPKMPGLSRPGQAPLISAVCRPGTGYLSRLIASSQTSCQYRLSGLPIRLQLKAALPDGIANRRGFSASSTIPMPRIGKAWPRYACQPSPRQADRPMRSWGGTRTERCITCRT